MWGKHKEEFSFDIKTSDISERGGGQEGPRDYVILSPANDMFVGRRGGRVYR